MAAGKRISCILIDLSGTLHVENQVIAGSIEALDRLRRTNLKLRFVTNTTKESKRLLVDRLNNLGFGVRTEEIFTSLTAAKIMVLKNNIRPMLMLQPEAREDFQDVPTSNPNGVLVGLSPDSFNYQTMNEAFRILGNAGSLIAVHKGRYYKTLEGLSLGPGPFVSALEYATGVEAKVVGKPQSNFFQSALESVDGLADETIMIGDDIRDDIGGAQAIGMRGILVKTGKYREGDESAHGIKPFAVCDKFVDAVDMIIELL
ncbi:Haloacid dehalogenase-like hydrolase domain-containing protein 2 [Trichoplax sp. H2]|uniref:Haloacid dehalogenase-like hydrolase domain-containing protein 2 n=1 Tax=Trichoplax adhaerens TaxID=10228 RepID=B3RU17_TRIAD|nr:hypothetical protein TRIADDRAFT_24696 [Trichoplax adhaerens]EDV25265.1 hypothetical protein TRIADDRAFT_24696 [Trichoplax adhaerens]RDD39026.1 Haloacid dehalogenase-like hydrolase domain-containing protein 2 [Trichoplax sp. H2]|eukprot:XP_002111298.1 hypothetical protein TRIADDRAFT_24696 [Trichoplax adhaerens]